MLYHNTKITLTALLITLSGLAKAQTKIVLKLDDIGANKNTCKATPVFDYLLQKQLKFTMGVIAKRLDETAGNVLGKYITAKSSKGDNLTEVWHHGLDHSNKNGPDNNSMEFKGTSYAFQKEHFDTADQLVLKYLGVQMHAFGSPYNALDTTTIRVISENPNYNIVMYTRLKLPENSKITILNNGVEMEQGTGNPNYDHFIADFAKHSSYEKSFMILQGHPGYWNAEHLEQFKKIIDFLASKGCEFVLPRDLVKNIANK